MQLMTIVDPLGLVPRATRAADDAARAGANAFERLVAGPIVDAIVDAAVREGVVERIVDALLARGVVEHVGGRVMAGPEIDQLLETALDSPRVSALADRVLASEGLDRLIGQVAESRLVDATVARVLASDDLWVIVEEIAKSPAVTHALTHQSAGFVDQVADEVGERSRRADARLERGARRLLRRRPRPGGDAPETATGVP